MTPHKRKREGESSPEPSGPAENVGYKRSLDEQSPCLDDPEDETVSRSPDDAVFLSNSSSTHDTTASSFHFASIHDFTRDLQSALEASWKSRQDVTRSKYKAVKALLVSWEDDDLGVEAEVDVLGQMFEEVYHYDVEKWKIPAVNSFRALDKRVRSVAEEIWETPSSLFIVYYAGHARPSRGLGSYPLWVS